MRIINGDDLKSRIDQEPTDGMYKDEIKAAIDEQPTMDSDCETCCKAGTCKHNTRNPGLFRFNCPLWKP